MPYLMHEHFGVYSDGWVDIADTGVWILGNNSIQVGSGLGPYAESVLMQSGGNDIGTTKATRTVRSWAATFDIGFAFWMSLGSGGVAYSSTQPIVYIYDANSREFEIRLKTDGNVSMTMVNLGPASANSIWSSVGVNVADKAWHHIEGYLKVASDSSGIAKLWIDGVNQVNQNSVRTLANSNNTSWQDTQWYNVSSNFTPLVTAKTYFANLLFWCGSDEIVSPIGMHRMQLSSPNSAGTNAAFTPSSGTNFESVNRAKGIEKDNRYVETINSGNTDTYQFGDISSVAAPNTILGVITTAVARNTDVGAKNFADVVVSSGTTQVGTPTLLGTAYRPFSQFKKFDPATTTYWLQAAINSAEFGIRAL